MAGVPSPNRIKTHQIYTIWEAAEALGRHRQTVIRWIKDKGLIADQSRVPWLIRGADLKDFLGHRRAKVRTRLALHHLYCLGCKEPQEPDGKFAEYSQQTATTGMLKALCPACGCILNKVVKRADLEVIRAKIEVAVQQANPRLVSLLDPRSNDTSTPEASTHDKTQLG
ncbi:helix-turn-helix domain-containing protein [Puniceibacterium sp. IMCC21224]|uniref:helix-turn-helix domain-containing protein n=1 Tax=Puniceibacterium sp. IMCC21224 TaxID=1618204 RepID=UPI00064DE16A|nr:helix-turn-helix domain-containing protein [Puniceibacterium sp. IMCC21224]KMK68599.1 Helix-turn-helix domain [Puniceibacterium sp. IMCC21224]